MGSSASLTANSYIHAVDDRWLMRFQCFPRGITDSKTANWQAQEIIGRSFPIQGYASSGPRSLNLTLQFHASMHEGDGYLDVRGHCDHLQSLQYPEYGGLIYPPSRCFVKVGAIAIFGICTQCQIEYPDEGAWSVDSYEPYYAVASLAFDECAETPISASERRSGSIATGPFQPAGAFV